MTVSQASWSLWLHVICIIHVGPCESNKFNHCRAANVCACYISAPARPRSRRITVKFLLFHTSRIRDARRIAKGRGERERGWRARVTRRRCMISPRRPMERACRLERRVFKGWSPPALVTVATPSPGSLGVAALLPLARSLSLSFSLFLHHPLRPLPFK